MTRATAFALSLAATLCSIGRVYADAAPAKVVGEGGWLIPSFQLAGATDDKAKFKAALGYVLPTTNGHVILWPRLEVSSPKGLATIFSTGDSTTLPWRGGIVVSIVDPGIGDVAAENTEVENATKVLAYDACAIECLGQADCKFKVSESEAKKTALTPEKLCKRGQEIYLRYDAGLPGRKSFPKSYISIGLDYGRNRYKFLTGTSGVIDEREDESVRHSTVRVGASVLFVPLWYVVGPNRAMTLEGRALFAHDWKESSDTVRWCNPEGSVTGEPGSTVELCQDRTLGRPTKTHTLTLAAGVGIGDSGRQFWRGSVGLFAALNVRSMSALKDESVFGVEAPIYMSFASRSAPEGYAGDYKGVLRVTPRLQRKQEDGEWGTEILVTVEVLAQRTIFAEVLD